MKSVMLPHVDWDTIPNSPRSAYSCVMAEWAGAVLKYWLTATDWAGLGEITVIRGCCRNVLHYGHEALADVERELATRP